MRRTTRTNTIAALGLAALLAAAGCTQKNETASDSGPRQR